MAALALFSRRWVLRILWELRNGPAGFRELRTRCEDMSPDTLATRLAELSEAGLIERDADGSSALTPLGAELKPVLRSLAHWADAWEAEMKARRDTGADRESSP